MEGAATQRIERFDFEHPALRLAGAFFALLPVSNEPVYKVEIGDMRGATPLASLRATFAIPADGFDGRLLDLVSRGLRFVRLIRHGDAVPCEILDGTASWPVEDQHRDKARAHIAASVYNALPHTSPAPAPADTEALIAAIKARGGDVASLAQLASDQTDLALDRVELLAGELAFIEALRDWWRPIFDLPNRLRHIERRSRERGLVDEVRRVNQLLQEPLSGLRHHLEAADGAFADIGLALAQFNGTVDFVRRCRDTLHFLSLDWSGPRDLWAMVKAEDAPEDAVHLLYRFLAQRHLAVQVWTRLS